MAAQPGNIPITGASRGSGLEMSEQIVANRPLTNLQGPRLTQSCRERLHLPRILCLL